MATLMITTPMQGVLVFLYLVILQVYLDQVMAMALQAAVEVVVVALVPAEVAQVAEAAQAVEVVQAVEEVVVAAVVVEVVVENGHGDL